MGGKVIFIVSSIVLLTDRWLQSLVIFNRVAWVTVACSKKKWCTEKNYLLRTFSRFMQFMCFKTKKVLNNENNNHLEESNCIFIIHIFWNYPNFLELLLFFIWKRKNEFEMNIVLNANIWLDMTAWEMVRPCPKKSPGH